jgi:glycosyltransferase 2 family protein
MLEEAAARLAGVDVRLALVALVFQFGSLACRSLAWRNVLAAAFPDRRVALLDVGSAFVAGVALNSYLPVRGGEVAKAVLVRTRIAGSTLPAIASSMSVVLLFDAVFGASLFVVAWAAGAVPYLPGAASLAAAGSLVHDHLAAALAIALLLLIVVRFAVRRAARRMQTVWKGLGQGVAILDTPGRYLRRVVLVQLAAWGCRIGVVYFLLAAFHVPAGLVVAALVVVLGGLSNTASVTPGGAGTQQIFHTYALQGTATTAAAVSFSVGMQVAVTLVNTALGLVGAMILFRTVRPRNAIRSGLRLIRAPEQVG